MNESAAVEVYQASSLEERKVFASTIAQAGDLVPAGYRNHDGTPNQGKVLVAFEMGAALGMPPIIALRELYVVEGRPSISALAMQALVRKAGHRVRVWTEGGGASVKAIATVHRSDDPEFEYRSEWDASRVDHLKGKANYKNHLAQMLVARAVGEVCRQAAPEALMGASYTTEEVRDFGPEGFIQVDENPQAAPIVDPSMPVADAAGEVIEDAQVVEEEPDNTPQEYVRPKALEAILVEAETAVNPPNLEGWRSAYRKAKRGGYLTHPIPPNETVDSYLTDLGEQITALLTEAEPTEEPTESN